MVGPSSRSWSRSNSRSTDSGSESAFKSSSPEFLRLNATALRITSPMCTLGAFMLVNYSTRPPWCVLGGFETRPHRGTALEPHFPGAGDLQGTLHRARLVAGLLVFQRGNRVGDDAAAGLEVGYAVLEEGCAEGYAGVEAAVDAVVARGASVGAAAGA